MTDAELQVTRESLGLTVEWLAEHLHVSAQMMQRWEAGTATVPDFVRDEVRAIQMLTDKVAAKLAVQYNRRTVREMETYRSDVDHLLDQTESPVASFPASWHRSLASRVAAQVPGLRLSFWELKAPSR